MDIWHLSGVMRVRARLLCAFDNYLTTWCCCIHDRAPDTVRVNADPTDVVFLLPTGSWLRSVPAISLPKIFLYFICQCRKLLSSWRRMGSVMLGIPDNTSQIGTDGFYTHRATDVRAQVR